MLQFYNFNKHTDRSVCFEVNGGVETRTAKKKIRKWHFCVEDDGKQTYSHF